jgi:hypothetical protein
VALRSRISSKRQELQPGPKKVPLENFRAKVADSALAERVTARMASASRRRAGKDVREAEKAEKKA